MAETAAIRPVAAFAQHLGHAVAGLDQSSQCLIIHSLGAVSDRLDTTKSACVQPEFRGPPYNVRDAAVSGKSKANGKVALACRKSDMVTQVGICPSTFSRHISTISQLRRFCEK